MKHQNFKSDFTTVHTFSEVRDGSTERIEVPQHVRLTFFTPQRRGCVIAERNGDVMNGCSVSDDGMTLTASVPLSRTFLGEGELICEVAVISEDAGFPGGKRTEVTPVKMDVELWPGETDGGDGVESDIILGIVSDAVARVIASAEQAVTDAKTATDKVISDTQAATEKAVSDSKEAVGKAVTDAQTAVDKLTSDVEAAESSRQTAETARENAETARRTAETERGNAETARQAAEAERGTEYGQFKFDINEALACIEGYRDLPDWEEDADGGSTRAFKAGEYCKHPWTDPDTGETKSHVFRFLSSVAVGDAWDADRAVLTSVFGELKEMVIGDTETLVIGVSSSDSLMAVSGVSVIVKNITRGSQQTLVTDADGIVTVQIDKGDIVDIEAAQQSGYQKPGTVRHKATMNTAYVYLVCQKTVETCTVTVHLHNAQGSPVGEGDVIALNLDNSKSLTATVDANGNAVFEGVPQGHTGTVRVIRHVGYVTPTPQSFDTSHTAVSLDFTYTEIVVSIFMVREDGTEVLLEDWEAEDTLVAIHLATQDLADHGADYYVKPEHLTQSWFQSGEGRALKWSTANTTFPNVPYDSDTDWDGAGNTAAMLADAQDALISTPAAEWVTKQSFSLGGKTATGYIGTRRQLTQLIDNHEAVEAMLIAAGFTPNFYPQSIWSSTQIAGAGACNWYRSKWVDYSGKLNAFAVVPFFAI